jgi:hypothetical protein
MNTLSRRLGIVLFVTMTAMVAGTPAGATVILTDMNSSVSIDENSQDGAYEWLVDGEDMLYQQWFWYRIGSSGPEASIDTISAPVVLPFLGTRGVSLTYGGVGTPLTVEVTYFLTGGALGSTQSDLAEVIRITNTGSGPIDLHFFQYSDFDLCDIGGDTVNVVSGNQVRQSDGTCSLSETVVAPAADLWEAGEFPTTLDSLNDGMPTTLNGTSSFGPGDATWAYQWDRTIGAGSTFIISKDKSIQPIPEPGTLILIGAGLAALALRRHTA